jgi:hypothetical protein
MSLRVVWRTWRVDAVLAAAEGRLEEVAPMIRQFSHPRNGRVQRIVLGAVFGLGAIGLLTVWSIRQASAPPENGREIAAAFLADLREGRIDAAWAATSAEFRSFLGRERLIAFVRANPVLRGPVEFADFRELEANGLRLLASQTATQRIPRLSSSVLDARL